MSTDHSNGAHQQSECVCELERDDDDDDDLCKKKISTNDNNTGT